MKYAEHERAPIPVPRVRILKYKQQVLAASMPKNGPCRYVCQKKQRTIQKLSKRPIVS